MTKTPPPSPQQIAEAVAQVFARQDRLVDGLGIVIDQVAPGQATLRMTVRQSMLNALGSCHGGILFALADVAFALACNNRNHNMVAMTCTISFLHPVALGEEITASARETLREGRNGLYDISLRNAEQQVVAEFRGHARAVPGHLLPDTE